MPPRTFEPFVCPAPAVAAPEAPPVVVSRSVALARAAALGDRDATRELLAEVAPRVGRAVRAVLGRQGVDHEDVEQQALLAFVQALPTFRGECEPIHFASRIAARLAVVAARQARLAHARRDDGVDLDAHASQAHPHEDLVRRRRMDLFRDLLAQIAPAQAETLTLRVVLGWSVAEIAAATVAPLDTVRSRIRLAKEALRKAIERDPALAEELGLDREIAELAGAPALGARAMGAMAT